MSSVFAGEVKEEKYTYEGVRYRVVRLAPSSVTLVWKDTQGRQMQSFHHVQDYYSQQGSRCIFMMNAGIYEPDGKPSGLHIENGEELLPINEKSGKGNFYLKPNGVLSIFSGVEEVALISKTEDYAIDIKKFKNANKKQIF